MNSAVVVKIVLVGEGGTGKTAFLKQLVEGTFSESYIPTIGV